MTQPNTPTADTPPDTGAPATPPAAPPAEEQQTPPNEPDQNSEAARYRVQRNEARAERDALAERVAGYQRRECEQLVADVLAQPADLWDIAGANVGDFFNEDGTLNEDDVLAAAQTLLEQRPGLRRDPNSGQPQYKSWGQHSGPVPGGSVGWQQVVGSR